MGLGFRGRQCLCSEGRCKLPHSWGIILQHGAGVWLPLGVIRFPPLLGPQVQVLGTQIRKGAARILRSHLHMETEAAAHAGSL